MKQVSATGQVVEFGSVPGQVTILALGVNGWVQGNGPRAVLPLTRHQCSIHCENSRDERPQSTRDTPERSTKSRCK